MRFAILFLLGLAACGPIPVEQAEQQCLEQARLAERPRGEVFVGVGNGGRTVVEGSIGISTDFIAGRDPAEVFNSCVQGRSGQFPTRPLTAQPGWRR